ncbi:MAG: hypothetical protein GX874_07470 [Smithella sp.]|nr:hypothetical protein [Smithella sp.]
MYVLTHQFGQFPIGIWAVLAMLFVGGGVFTIFGQALSLLNWDAALRLRLQEDSRKSRDPVERTMGAMSQGEAVADVVVQGALILLASAGILLQHPVGFVAGIAQGVIWIYVTFLVLSQRWMLYRWEIVNNMARLKHVGPAMLLVAGIPGALIITCLVANRGFFGW